MTNRAIEGRLRKLETLRRPAGAAFFLAWGASMDDAEAVVAQVRQRGTISRDDAVVPAVWTGTGPIPASRWVRQGGMTEMEFEALMPALEQIAQSGRDSGLSARFTAAALSDETLVGMALGRVVA
jgi:hypothetical protein